MQFDGLGEVLGTYRTEVTPPLGRGRRRGRRVEPCRSGVPRLVLRRVPAHHRRRPDRAGHRPVRQRRRPVRARRRPAHRPVAGPGQRRHPPIRHDRGPDLRPGGVPGRGPPDPGRGRRCRPHPCILGIRSSVRGSGCIWGLPRSTSPKQTPIPYPTSSHTDSLRPDQLPARPHPPMAPPVPSRTVSGDARTGC
jgi:hypothetical protein